MKFRAVEKQVETLSITAAHNSPAQDVAIFGGDSLAYVMVLSAASTPGTATIQLFGSLDGVNYVAEGSTVSVAANGSYALKVDRPAYRYYRVQYAIASGSYTSTLTVLVKGDVG